MLLGLLLGASALLAGYAGLLSIAKEPLTDVRSDPGRRIPETDTKPIERLSRLQPYTAEASFETWSNREGRVEVVVRPRGALPQLDEGTKLRYAVLDGASNAVLVEKPLLNREPVSLGKLPAGKHHVVLAFEGQSPRYSYLTRSDVEIAEDVEAGEGPVVVDLAVELANVTVRVTREDPKDDRRFVPTVERVDDPDWRRDATEGMNEMPASIQELAVWGAEEEVVLSHLGEGRYRFVLRALTEEESYEIGHEFVIPGEFRVELVLPRPE